MSHLVGTDPGLLAIRVMLLHLGDAIQVTAPLSAFKHCTVILITVAAARHPVAIHHQH